MEVSYKVTKLGVGVGALGLALVEVKADGQYRLGQGCGVRLGDGGHGGGGDRRMRGPYVPGTMIFQKYAPSLTKLKII